MFSYFGSKSKFIKYYPPPIHNLVIEPFAGSARYACRYYDRDVWINDLDPCIVGIWRWIQQATKDDVRALPELKRGESLKDCDLPEDVCNLLGYAVARGNATPTYTVTEWGSGGTIRQLKQGLLTIVGRISHWRITNISYDQLDDVRATWYIDPPYQHMGDYYRCGPSKIDFNALGKWCKSRRGQVMVCEGSGADWLPFQTMIKRRRVRRKDQYEELIWYKSDEKIGLVY